MSKSKMQVKADLSVIKSQLRKDEKFTQGIRLHAVYQIAKGKCSLPADTKLINQSVRIHWRVENSLHWVLDVGFNEDASRKKTGFAVQNYSLLSSIALNCLKTIKQPKWVLEKKD